MIRNELWITRGSNVLKRLFISASQKPAMRKIARRSFGMPLFGPAIRRSVEKRLPRGERIWFKNESGPARGLWIKVEPYWESGYMGTDPEPGVAEALAEHLDEGKCFYDAGAHIGFYSMIAARLVGPTGRVLALEPDPDNVLVMKENIAKNELGWVKVVAAAVWSADGQMEFERGADTPSRMSGKVVSPNAAPSASGNVVSCAAVTLDHLSCSDRPPEVVKVDVEGGETAVLHGARATLEHHHPALLIEVHSAAAMPEVRQFLELYRYTMRTIGENGDKGYLYCV
jgi:FkbM family methyltransferase